MKWISVIKRLPKWGERVLVAHRRYDWSNARHKWTRLKRLGVTPATFWVEDENGPRFTDGDNVVANPLDAASGSANGQQVATERQRSAAPSAASRGSAEHGFTR